MRRATQVSLVLMTGTAVALGLSTCEAPSAECREARAAGLPDAEAVCARTSSSGYRSSSGRSFFSSGSGKSSGGSAHTGSTRGGFGGSAHSSGG